MQSKLIHYTVNTGNTADCSKKNFNQKAIDTIKPIAQRALLEGQTTTALPHPFTQYNAKVTIAQSRGSALFDLSQGEDLININACAWTEEGQTEVWEMFESLYISLSQKFDTLLGNAPRCPDRLPWLATIILPSPAALGLTWLADFEQCLSIALIQEAKSRPERKGGKGF